MLAQRPDSPRIGIQLSIADQIQELRTVLSCHLVDKRSNRLVNEVQPRERFERNPRQAFCTLDHEAGESTA